MVFKITDVYTKKPSTETYPRSGVEITVLERFGDDIAYLINVASNDKLLLVCRKNN